LWSSDVICRPFPSALSLAALLTVCLAPGASQAEELKVTGEGFTLVLPSPEWQVVSAATKQAELAVLGPERFGADRPTLTVVVGTADNGGGRWETPEGFRDGLVTALKQEGAAIESTDFALGGKESVKATVATKGDARSDNLIVVGVRGDRGICLLFGTPKGTLAEIRPDFDRILSSFRFVSVAKGDSQDFSRYGFTIRLPETGWVRVSEAEKQDKSLALALQTTGDPEKVATFSIMLSELSAARRGPEALDALALDALRELANQRDVTVGEIEHGALASQPSLSINVKGKDGEGKLILVVRDRQLFHIAWSAPVGELATYEPDLESIVNSIRFVEAKTGR